MGQRLKTTLTFLRSNLAASASSALKKKSNILFIFMFALSLFGIFFVGLLGHEATHVLQSKSPESICYNMQQDSFMSVIHKGKISEEFRTYTEKWAIIIQIIAEISLSIILSVLISIAMIHQIIKK